MILATPMASIGFTSSGAAGPISISLLALLAAPDLLIAVELYPGMQATVRLEAIGSAFDTSQL